MQIEIQLDDDRSEKLVQLQQQTQQNLNQVIEQAIEAYYQQLQPARKRAIDIFKESGFIGSIDADPTVSANHRSVVQDIIQRKFDQSRES